PPLPPAPDALRDASPSTPEAGQPDRERPAALANDLRTLLKALNNPFRLPFAHRRAVDGPHDAISASLDHLAAEPVDPAWRERLPEVRQQLDSLAQILQTAASTDPELRTGLPELDTLVGDLVRRIDEVVPEPALIDLGDPDSGPESTADSRPGRAGRGAAPGPGGGRGAAGGSVRVIPSRFADDAAARAAYPWLALVNPSGSDTNCVLTVIVSDMNAAEGRDSSWQAPPELALPEEHLLNYQRQLLRLADDAAPPVYRTDVEAVRTAMAAAPPGTRGVLLVRDPVTAAGLGGTSHAFNVLRDEHGVVFLDGQHGGLARMPAYVGELLFLPLSGDVPRPAGAATVDPAELGGTAGTLGDGENGDDGQRRDSGGDGRASSGPVPGGSGSGPGTRRGTSGSLRPTLPPLVVPPVPARNGSMLPPVDGPAAALLNELYAWEQPSVTPHPADAVLGPDLLGLLEPAPMPDFLADGFSYDQLYTDQLYAFFDFLDMAHPDRVQGYQVRPEDLQAFPETIWQDVRTPNPEDGTPDRRRWAPDTSRLPEHLRLLPDVIELPLMVHAIWFGGPLTGTATTDDFRRNIEAFARRTGRAGFRTNLFTDVTRAEFLAAARMPEFRSVEETENDRLDAVRDMLVWAQRHNIRLINIHEVFHAEVDLPIQRFLLAELNKQQGRGYAAAADIVKVLLLTLFGGWQTDGDNTLSRAMAHFDDGTRAPVWLEEVSTLFQEDGYAIHAQPDRGLVGNSSMFGSRGHPFFQRYLERLEQNYEKTQRALLPVPDDDERAAAETWVRNSMFRPRRHSVMSRTGPDNLGRLSQDVGHRRPFPDLPHLRQVGMGTANSWMSRRPFEARRSYLPHEVPEVLARVTATLIRGLRNREGDLHLTEVAPVVNGLPDPEAAWEAVIEYILQTPELAGQVRTVTDRALVPPEHDDGDVEVANVGLPPIVQQRLGLVEVPGQDPPGSWRLAELSRPVTIAPRRTGNTPLTALGSGTTPRRPSFLDGPLVTPDTPRRSGRPEGIAPPSPASPLLPRTPRSPRWPGSPASGRPGGTPTSPDGFVRREFADQLLVDLSSMGLGESRDRREHLESVQDATRWWSDTESGDRLDGLFSAVRTLEALLGLDGSDGRPPLLSPEDAGTVLVGVHTARDGNLAMMSARRRDRVGMAADQLTALLESLRELRSPAAEVANHLRQAQRHASDLLSALRSTADGTGAGRTASPGAAGPGGTGPRGDTSPGGAAGTARGLLDPSTSRYPHMARESGPVAGGSSAEVSPPMRAAVAALPEWDGTSLDCAPRVRSLLTALGARNRERDDQTGQRDVDTIAGQLGGRFRDSDLERLAGLRPGGVTAVWVSIPNDRMHVVLVERLDEHRFVQVETQPRQGNTFTVFRLDDRLSGRDPLPVVFGGTVQLVLDENGELGQFRPASAGSTPEDPASTAASDDFPGPPQSALTTDPLHPKPSWTRQLANGVRLLPPPAESAVTAADLEAAAARLTAPPGATVLAAVLPSLDMDPPHLATTGPTGLVEVSELLDDLIPRSTDQVLLLHLHDADLNRSATAARDIQAVIDERRRRGEPVPAAVLVSAPAARSVWDWVGWRSGPRWILHGSLYEDLPTALTMARSTTPPPIDLHAEVRARLRGEPNRYGYADASLAARLAAEQGLDDGEYPVLPTYSATVPPAAPDRGPFGPTVRVPIGDAVHPADQLGRVRDWLRLGVLRPVPGPGERTVEVHLPDGLHGGTVTLPRAGDEPEQHLMVLAPRFLTVPDAEGQPVRHELDLWVNAHADGRLVATEAHAAVRGLLLDSIPPDSLGRIRVETGLLNDQTVDGHPPGTLLRSTADGEWITAEQYVRSMLPPTDDGADRPIVVLPYPPGDLPWPQTPFHQALEQHAIVVSPRREQRRVEGRETGQHWAARQGGAVVWTNREQRGVAQIRRSSLATLLTDLTGGRRPGGRAYSGEAAVHALAQTDGPVAPEVTAAARRAFDAAPVPVSDQPRWLPLPATLGQATARTADGWLRGRELAVLRPDDGYVQTRIAVPGRYVRDVPVEFSDGQRRSYQLVDLAAIVADRPRVRGYANGNLRLETAGAGRRNPVAPAPPGYVDPPAYEAPAAGTPRAGQPAESAARRTVEPPVDGDRERQARERETLGSLPHPLPSTPAPFAPGDVLTELPTSRPALSRRIRPFGSRSASSVNTLRTAGLARIVAPTDATAPLFGKALLDRLDELPPDDPAADLPSDGAPTRKTVDWLRARVAVATSDASLNRLWPAGPTADERLAFDLTIAAHGDPATLETLGRWLTAVLNQEANQRLVRWAQRNGHTTVPRTRVSFTLAPAASWSKQSDWVKLAYDKEATVPPGPHPLTGQRDNLVRARRLELPWPPPGGAESVRAMARELAAEVAPLAVAADRSAARPPRIELLGQYDESLGNEDAARAARDEVRQAFVVELHDAVHRALAADTAERAAIAAVNRLHDEREAGDPPLDAAEIAAAAAAGRAGHTPPTSEAVTRIVERVVGTGMHTAALGATPHTPPVVIKFVPPGLPPAMYDSAGPAPDLLSAWNTSDVLVGEDGWWRATSPVDGLDALVTALPRESFRTVDTELRDVADPIRGDRVLSWFGSAVRYDVARVLVEQRDPAGALLSSTPVRVLRLRLHLKPQSGVSWSDVTKLQRHAERAARRLNERLNLPGGDQLHVQVVFTAEDWAHHVVTVPKSLPGTANADSSNWPVSLLAGGDDPAATEKFAQDVLLHEMLHLLGLPDEYPSFPGTGSEPVRIFGVPRRSAAVPPSSTNYRESAVERAPSRTDSPALMGYLPNSRPELIAVRYLTRIWQIQENQVLPPVTTVRRVGTHVTSVVAPGAKVANIGAPWPASSQIWGQGAAMASAPPPVIAEQPETPLPAGPANSSGPARDTPAERRTAVRFDDPIDSRSATTSETSARDGGVRRTGAADPPAPRRRRVLRKPNPRPAANP
ncbi:hypothetical protein E1211_27725, partial [Micromonospora sp. 15K316]|uniref:toxin glutamine deamidase domain-containing protein n=1 Tax=Micromonospora sp. 15K316 TaxID=2530376 RepID=UPI0010D1B96D